MTLKISSKVSLRAGSNSSKRNVIAQQAENITAICRTGFWSSISLRIRLSTTLVGRQRNQSDHHLRPDLGEDAVACPKAGSLNSNPANFRLPSQRKSAA